MDKIFLENHDKGITIREIDNILDVEMVYPRVEGKLNCIELNIVDVRAIDGIRISYDYDRDGWVIEQSYKEMRQSDKYYNAREEVWLWKETAFLEAWALEEE